MSAEKYKKENTELFEFFLENSFYKSWRNPNDLSPTYINYKNLELMINHKCNLKCKYCYMDKYHKQYFPKGSQDRNTLLHNTDLMIDWLEENGFAPVIEIFAGDSLSDPTCRKIIHKILDAALDGRRVCNGLVLPTNMGWVMHDKQIEDVENILEKAEFAGVNAHVSGSVDGKYMEVNRPFKSAKKGYSDDMYHKMFSFITRHASSGVHPMIYSNNIEQAKENFLWWQEQFEKYNIGWYHMYMLEVRNQEWTLEQTNHYADFIKFLVRWVYNKVERDPERFINFMFDMYGFNILILPFARSMRGMPCSIQSCLTVRLGDLMVVPCHRTAYKHMETAQFITEDDKIVGLEAKNIELWFGIQSLDSGVYPYCEKCSVNKLCTGGCLGSQYEATGSIFTPIPTVCRLAHAKIAALVEVFDELDLTEHVCRRTNIDQARAFLKIKKYMEESNV